MIWDNYNILNNFDSNEIIPILLNMTNRVVLHRFFGR